MSQQLTIVMYHYVRELASTRYPEIKGLLITQFKEQLCYLEKYYQFVTIDDCLDCLINKIPLPSNACLLTFDDAFIDHFITVFPLLEEKRIQGCFFPPARAILSQEVLDVHKIHFILATTSYKIKSLIKDIYACLDKYREQFQLGKNSYYYTKLAIEDQYDTADVIFIKRLLQVELEDCVRRLITNELFEKYVSCDEKSFSQELYMDVEQLKCMSRNGMYIGGHGSKHQFLNEISVSELESEINETIELLNRVNTPTVDWVMCYPYGVYNNTVIEILKKNSCALAFTTKVDIATISKENAYTLERLDTNDFPKLSSSSPSALTKKIFR